MFAWFMARFGHESDRYLAAHKTRLFASLSGTVLEIGPGAGANLRYLPAAGIRYIGIEPNPYMSRHLKKKARRLGIDCELCQGAAEELPLETVSVDFVISTLVLCSVVDQPTVLREIHRVLKPGGGFLFIEHVAAPRGTSLRYIQTALKPIWSRMGDGCRPDRETCRAPEDAGFGTLQLEEFAAPLPIVSPHIAGYAIKEAAHTNIVIG